MINDIGKIKIEQLTIKDLPYVSELQPEGWGDILPNFRYYIKSSYCFPTKVTLDNKLIGLGAAILHDNVAWLANIIVKPEYKHNGIGTSITKRMMDNMLQQVPAVLLIATDLGFPIYKKLGFKAIGNYSLYPNVQLPASKSENIVPYSQDYYHQICNLDVYITGERRPELLSKLLPGSFLYIKEDKVIGCLFAGYGEGLILALTEESGIALLSKHLETPKNISIPKDNKVANDFLTRLGFEPIPNKCAMRMYFGKKPKWKPEFVFGRIGGNLG
jgi:N-acetylglutamate synthase-like GNAT family acetyltransferase